MTRDTNGLVTRRAALRTGALVATGAGAGAGAVLFASNPAAADTEVTFEISNPDAVESGDGEVDWIGIRNFHSKIEWEYQEDPIHYGRSTKDITVDQDDERIVESVTFISDTEDQYGGPVEVDEGGSSGYWEFVPDNDQIDFPIAHQEGVDPTDYFDDVEDRHDPVIIDYDNGWSAPDEGESITYSIQVVQTYHLYEDAEGDNRVVLESEADFFDLTVTNLEGETRIQAGGDGDAGVDE